jgi:hypothetical protein
MCIDRSGKIGGALRVVAAFTPLLVGCSDGLVDGSWPGESLLTLQGPVVMRQGAPNPDGGAGGEQSQPGTLKMAVLWSQWTGGAGPKVPVATVTAQSVTTSEFPARYRLELVAPPDADQLGEADGSGRIGVGTVVVYVDRDGDGAYDASVDSLVGGAAGRLLLYSPSGAIDSRLGAVAAGYQRLRLPKDAVCGGPGKPPPLVPDFSAEMPIEVNTSLPDGALVDLNCDGGGGEWGKACPPPHVVREQCAGTTATWPCDVCQSAP